MKSWEIMAFAYDAALHCPDCAAKTDMDLEGAVDSEGNVVTPVFADSEDYDGQCCNDCLCELGNITIER